MDQGIVHNSTAEFYDEVYTANPGKWANIDRDFLAFKLSSRVLKRVPERMLDFGCGNGHTLAFFKCQWPDLHCYGVDISRVALQIARKRVRGTFWDEVMDWWKDFDLITVMGVAEHFPDPASELAQIAGYLKPEGLLYLEAPNCLAWSPDKTEGFRMTHDGADQMEWHWRRETWEEEIDKAGLNILVSIDSGVRAWEFIWILGRQT